MKVLDLVALRDDLPEYGLVGGDIGTVALVHRGGEGFEIEFLTLSGTTIAVVTLLDSQVRPINPNEIAHRHHTGKRGSHNETRRNH